MWNTVQLTSSWPFHHALAAALHYQPQPRQWVPVSHVTFGLRQSSTTRHHLWVVAVCWVRPSSHRSVCAVHSAESAGLVRRPRGLQVNCISRKSIEMWIKRLFNNFVDMTQTIPYQPNSPLSNSVLTASPVAAAVSSSTSTTSFGSISTRLSTSASSFSLRVCSSPSLVWTAAISRCRRSWSLSFSLLWRIQKTIQPCAILLYMGTHYDSMRHWHTVHVH